MSDEELRKIIAEQEITFGRAFWRDEALSLVIELPLPPSVNVVWRSNRGRVHRGNSSVETRGPLSPPYE
jgi:hypothetical protein